MGYTVRDARWRYTEWLEPETGAIVARELYDHELSPTATANLIDDPHHDMIVTRLAALLQDRAQPLQR